MAPVRGIRLRKVTNCRITHPHRGWAQRSGHSREWPLRRKITHITRREHVRTMVYARGPERTTEVQAERLALIPSAPSAREAGRDQSLPESTFRILAEINFCSTGTTTVERTFAEDISTGPPKVVK